MLQDQPRLSARTFETGLAMGIIDGFVEAVEGLAKRRVGRFLLDWRGLKVAGAWLFVVGVGVLRHGNTRLKMNSGPLRVDGVCLGISGQARCFYFQEKQCSDALHI